MIKSTLEWAQEQDREHPGWREHFLVPEGHVYLCGNSLGLQHRDVADSIRRDLEDWARLAVEGHFEARTPWYAYHEHLTDDMASVVGALPIETVVMNSLTVNLHLMLTSFYRPQGRRRLLLMESGAFPSDQYAVETHLEARGYRDCIRYVSPRPGETVLRAEDIEQHIMDLGDELALAMFSGVHYYTGQAFPIRDIAHHAHRVGALAGFDLAHAAGNLALRLHDWEVDFAVWCSYKYLNGGPGGVGGCFVHERHALRTELPRLAGWWGNDPKTRFTMPEHFAPQAGAAGWQVSNAPVLAMAALRPSLRLFRNVGMQTLCERSHRLTEYLEHLLRPLQVELITPSDARGCQVSVRLSEQAKPVCDTLKVRGVMVDYRTPDVIRIAPVPLYNTFEDVWRAADALGQVLTHRNISQN